jgi:hypothetical protein
MKNISDQEKKKKNLVMAPKGGPDTMTDWPTDHQP